MWKVQGVIYAVCSFHNVDVRELVDDRKLIPGKTMSESVELILIDAAYNVCTPGVVMRNPIFVTMPCVLRVRRTQ